MLMVKGHALRLAGWTRAACLMAAAAFIVPAPAFAASPARGSGEIGRVNSFGVFVAYSNDSSHMLLGAAEHRKLLEFGGSYERRILMNRVIDWQYSFEIMPVALESDPVQTIHQTTTFLDPADVVTATNTQATLGPCQPISGSSTIPGLLDYTYTGTCSRQWTVGEAMSPVGFQWNFLTRRRMQPFLVGHGGYMYSTKPVPLNHAGSFNFTFDFGAGVELFRAHSRSIRAEFRYHHFSNDNTASQNPGVDNGLFQVAYCFGH